MARLTAELPLLTALDLPEDTAANQQTKLVQLRTEEANYTATSATTEQAAAWAKYGAGVQANIATLDAATELQAITDALGVAETNATAITTKLATLTTIANTYPAGTANQQTA